MNLPRVLVGIVTYEGKDYIWNKFWKNIESLSYPNHDVIIIDNSREKKYAAELKRRTKHRKNVRVFHMNRGVTSREAQAKCLNKLRDITLREGYDYFMSIESDLIPPRDIIERYIAHNVGVVGSIYLIGYADSAYQPPRPCLFGVKTNPNGSLGTFNYPPDKGFAFFGNGLVQIHGCGLGATLIKREILEKLRFWYDLNEPVKHSDVLFFADLHNIGKQAYVDTDLIIPHYNSKWDYVKDK
jgi:hypothetical protein